MRVNWSLTTKLTCWGIGMALIVFALSAFAISRLDQLQAYSDKARSEAVQPLEDSARFVVAFATARGQVHDHIAESDPAQMEKMETAIESALKDAETLITSLGSGDDGEEFKKLWGGLSLLMKDAREKSKSFLKLEAFDAINGTQALRQTLALEQRIAQVLGRAVKQTQEYQINSRILMDRIRYYMVVAGVAAFVLSVLVGVLLARSIGRPLRMLATIAARISKGDLQVQVPSQGRRDEIGLLSRAFQTMIEDLRKQIGRILAGVGVLNSAASEISTTLTQLSANAQNVAASLTETSTTVEQVKQAARVAGEKAQDVVKTALRAVEVSHQGSRATEETVERINLIREESESIRETVVKLSDHSRAVEEIIGVVQDIADQSKLLAVNASIEAARAGEQGKGFSVVAHEINSLADQSKEATHRVTSILREVRQWIGAVVAATQQGIKAVDKGVEQSVVAGESIAVLSSIVESSSQAASVIEAAGEQQFAGVDQVSTAMKNIERALGQNLSGMEMLRETATKVGALGEELQQLVEEYRI
ncbi:MAG: methyl-accepting chemotaxis protein [Pseudomonadota bacterium]